MSTDIETEPIQSARAAPARHSDGLTWFLISVVAGTLLQLRQASLWPDWCYGVLVLIVVGIVLVSWLYSRRLGRLTWVALGASMAFALAGWRATGMQAHAIDPALEGQDIAVVGVIRAMPQQLESGCRFEFDIEQSTASGRPVRLPPRIQLSWYERARSEVRLSPLLQAGDRWRMHVRLKAPHGNVNPHGFDYELWLWEHKIQATGYVRQTRSHDAPERLAVAQGYWIERLRQQVRDRILASGDHTDRHQSRNLGIVAALVTGDQRVIERADWRTFSVTGVAHLMAISGLHITMFAWLASAALLGLWRVTGRWLKAGRFNPCLHWPAIHAALLGGWLVAVVYALFSGWGVPAQRTVLMLGTVVALKLIGLRWPWTVVWLLAGAVVVVIQPWAMLRAGFWLSFVAVGVLFAADHGGAREAQPRVWLEVKQMLRQQLTVTMALTPLTLLLFGRASVAGLIANLLAIPWVSWIITPLAILGLLWHALWPLTVRLLEPLMALLQQMAGWPFASVALPTPPLYLAVAAVLGGLIWVLRWPWMLKLAALPLMLPVLLWMPARPAKGHFDFHAADIGQGSAVLIRTAHHALLYDTGPRYSSNTDAGERILVPLLQSLGERLDTVMLSHSDSDHVGGAPAVLTVQPDTKVMASYEFNIPERKGHDFLKCQSGQRWVWDDVTFSVLAPSWADTQRLRTSNALSCVLHIQAADGASALLAGDIPATQERALVKRYGTALQADVLLVPHHGSQTSSSVVFLDAVQPSLAVIQAGYRNAFGHPATKVVQRYRTRGVRLENTTHCGALHWSSEQRQQVRCERQQGQRYWHHHLATQ